ncbi:hypothetical protein GCM10010841_31740 [Deinococcus aerophilus]|uniref:Transposase DDE domain-containing protein n=1 Tax=Deinococcus aerophilus TaxID=522488 RepID=A0ABQ2GZH4_9DEIO|nr:hypothetical protein GCM10010841_31740 [Deinococcus aerophilus]
MGAASKTSPPLFTGEGGGVWKGTGARNSHQVQPGEQGIHAPPQARTSLALEPGLMNLMGMLGFETKFGNAVLAEVKIHVHVRFSLRCLSVLNPAQRLCPYGAPQAKGSTCCKWRMDGSAKWPKVHLQTVKGGT